MTLGELERFRSDLVRKILPDDLKWFTVALGDGVVVEVCNPVRVQFVRMIDKPVKETLPDGRPVTGVRQEPDPTMPVNWFVPVTKTETWDLARRFEVLPLTAAVADAAHNQALRIAKPQSPSLKDFPPYCKRLTAYATNYGTRLVSGCHKIWALSNVGHAPGQKELPAVNYGLHLALRPNQKVTEAIGRHRLRTPLVDADVIQGLANGHDGAWWDYSQMLQFMRAPKGITYKGKPFTLAQAVAASLPPLWDENEPLKPGLLP